MYAQVFKSSEAAKKAWASRKKTSKDFWAKGPEKKAMPSKAKKDEVPFLGSFGATMGLTR